MEKTVKIPLVRSTLGLLTTVHQLPRNYQVQYIKIKPESPLDLTIKPIYEHIHAPSSMTPPQTPSPLKKRYRESENESFTILIDRPIKEEAKGILSPLKKRYREDSTQIVEEKIISSPKPIIKRETTPKKAPQSVNQKASKATQQQQPQRGEKKSKAIRKLKFDEFRSSPVSGTIIRTLDEINENDLHESGDIDPEYNIVEVTEEAKAELAQIKNVIGAYVCKLCRLEFEDAFGLARHRCNCIVLLEYRCPECGKKFNCPANLASHRRWHKPRDQVSKKSESNNENDSASSFACKVCGKSFKRQAYLNKHLATHNKKSIGSSKSVSLATHNETSSTGSFNAHSHDSADVLIPQTVFNFNRTSTSPTHSSDSGEHELVINENSNSSVNSMASSSNASTKFKLLSTRFTEDENIAISALTNLRNGSSVIRHTLAV